MLRIQRFFQLNKAKISNSILKFVLLIFLAFCCVTATPFTLTSAPTVDTATNRTIVMTKTQIRKTFKIRIYCGFMITWAVVTEDQTNKLDQMSEIFNRSWFIWCLLYLKEKLSSKKFRSGATKCLLSAFIFVMSMLLVSDGLFELTL